MRSAKSWGNKTNSFQSFSPDSTELWAVIALCHLPFSSVILHEVPRSCLFFCGREESTAVPQTHLLVALTGYVQRRWKELLFFLLHHLLSAGGK